MQYEWTFEMINGKTGPWHKAKNHDTAFRAAIKAARRRYPDATGKGYVRGWNTEDGSTTLDFGHYTVFIKIRRRKTQAKC